MPPRGCAVTAKATPARVTASSAWVTSRAASESRLGSKAETTPTSNTVVTRRTPIPAATRAGPQLREGSPEAGPLQPAEGASPAAGAAGDAPGGGTDSVTGSGRGLAPAESGRALTRTTV